MIKIMHKMPGKQRGSAVLSIIIFAVFAYVIFVGIQYVPLQVESSSVNSVLESLEFSQKSAPLKSVRSVKEKLDGLLDINQLYDLSDSIDVRQTTYGIEVSVKYERDLNLLFETKTIQYEKTLTLR